MRLSNSPSARVLHYWYYTVRVIRCEGRRSSVTLEEGKLFHVLNTLRAQQACRSCRMIRTSARIRFPVPPLVVRGVDITTGTVQYGTTTDRRLVKPALPTQHSTAQLSAPQSVSIARRVSLTAPCAGVGSQLNRGTQERATHQLSQALGRQTHYRSRSVQDKKKSNKTR